MPRLARRQAVVLIFAFLAITTVLHLASHSKRDPNRGNLNRPIRPGLFRPKFKWKDVPQRYPIEILHTLPTGPIASIPKIQAEFETETYSERVERQARLEAVKTAFLHSWQGYKSNAWLQDEVAPLSGLSSNGFGGWGATMIDSLDTLWIMGLKKEFAFAVSELRKVDFTTTLLDRLNVFETTIRYLGGLLSAYDLSGHKYDMLLQKAIELGDMLYVAFDTPNRMPVTRWDWKNGALGGEQESDSHSLLAEVGSMTLEFTRLSQLTGDHKWYDAITRVTNVLYEWQNRTKIPGLWPVLIDTRQLNFGRDTTFSLGGMSDSLYEYFPKQHLMLGGRSDQYRVMYLTAIESAKENLFFQPLNPGNAKMLVSGMLHRKSAGNVKLYPHGEHLTCFAGGMVALGAKIFEKEEQLVTARQLVDGCLWAYETMPSGIMPEKFVAISCQDGLHDDCSWNEENWYRAVSRHRNKGLSQDENPAPAEQLILQDNLPPGMVEVTDSRYNLRPEAIESVFLLYRVTGDKSLQDKAWRMFRAISNATRTDIAFASVQDVREKKPALFDSMESFWTAETLKYFYLIFSEPSVVSLDDYILNTEAHPLLRAKQTS